jgi:hypothetical protein
MEFNLTERFTSADSRFTKAGISCPPQADEVQIIPKAFGIVHLIKFSAKNPRLRKARNRNHQL